MIILGRLINADDLFVTEEADYIESESVLDRLRVYLSDEKTLRQFTQIFKIQSQKQLIKGPPLIKFQQNATKEKAQLRLCFDSIEVLKPFIISQILILNQDKIVIHYHNELINCKIKDKLNTNCTLTISHSQTGTCI